MPPLLAKTFSIESRELVYQLKQSYFLEDLLRPVFVWGVGIGTLLLIVGCLARDVRLRGFALAVVLASSLAVIPYLQLRRKAADPEHGRAAPSAKITRLRQDTRWVFLTLAGLAAGTWVWGRKDRLGPLLTSATLIGGVAATSFGMWLEAYDAGAMHFTARPSKTAPRPSTVPPPAPLPQSPPDQ